MSARTYFNESFNEYNNGTVSLNHSIKFLLVSVVSWDDDSLEEGGNDLT